MPPPMQLVCLPTGCKLKFWHIPCSFISKFLFALDMASQNFLASTCFLLDTTRLYVLAETQTLHLCLACALIVSWLCRHFWGKWAACIFLGERASDIACSKHQLESYSAKRHIPTPDHGSLPLRHIFYSSVISYRD